MPPSHQVPLLVLATATVLGVLARVEMLIAVLGGSYTPVPPSSRKRRPGVCVARSSLRTAPSPSRPTQITIPSEEIAILSGSLPTNIGVPSTPVLGSMGTMLFPRIGPPLLGTEA